ncbi:hypothetical protein MZA99_01020 [Haemophilus influenzae]
MQEHIIDLSERYALKLNENHVYILYKIELNENGTYQRAKAAQYVRIYLPCWTS